MAQRYVPRGMSRRRRTPLDAPPPPLLVFGRDVVRRIREGWPVLRLPLTVLAVAHLVLVALFPGGRNALFGVTPQETPAYLTLFRVGDALGFRRPAGRDGFLIYKVYTEDGEVRSGIFPDNGVSPRLRFDRWVAAGHVATGPHPGLHRQIADYIVERLPEPPVRLELFAARWRWDRNSLAFPWPGGEPATELHTRLLGTYNGVTRDWQPAEGVAAAAGASAGASPNDGKNR